MHMTKERTTKAHVRTKGQRFQRQEHLQARGNDNVAIPFSTLVDTMVLRMAKQIGRKA